MSGPHTSGTAASWPGSRGSHDDRTQACRRTCVRRPEPFGRLASRVRSSSRRWSHPVDYSSTAETSNVDTRSDSQRPTYHKTAFFMVDPPSVLGHHALRLSTIRPVSYSPDRERGIWRKSRVSHPPRLCPCFSLNAVWAESTPVVPSLR